MRNKHAGFAATNSTRLQKEKWCTSSNGRSSAPSSMGISIVTEAKHLEFLPDLFVFLTHAYGRNEKIKKGKSRVDSRKGGAEWSLHALAGVVDIYIYIYTGPLRILDFCLNISFLPSLCGSLCYLFYLFSRFLGDRMHAIMREITDG